MKIKIVSFVFVFILLSGLVAESANAQTYSRSFSGNSRGASSSTYQYRPSYETYYGSSAREYWPILGNKETCEARQDIILNVAPAGCQPSVVRSDLLAEQNVPVFCQIDALKINPLIDINKIRNIRFSGEYPAEVVGSGFHPARAALRTQDKLLGSPLLNNLGYVVVVLKRQPDESKLPESVSVNLNAQIEYVADNVLGVGRSEFILQESNTEQEWEREKLKQGFWGGRYFVRLESADPNFADVSIYQGDKKVTTSRVKKGELSNDFYFPGLYCRAGLQIAYDGFVSPEKRARIEISDGENTDMLDVYSGSRFLDDRCVIGSIDVRENDYDVGNVRVNCAGQSFNLAITNGTNLSLTNKDLGTAKNYFDKAINNYELVADDYTYEKEAEADGARYYGQIALERAEQLALEYGQSETRLRLLEKLRERYPDAENLNRYQDKINEMRLLDSTNAAGVAVFEEGNYNIRLVRVYPEKQARATLSWGGQNHEVKTNEKFDVKVIGNENKNGEVVFESLVGNDGVKLGAYCRNDNGEISATRSEVSLKEGEVGKEVCGVLVNLQEVNAEEYAKIRLIPKADRTKTESNFNVTIGIEKRAIKLTPDKTIERIKDLNETIGKWTKISEALGKTVTGLKGACFATAAVLTFKNFVSGLSGEALARQQAMNGEHGWKEYCRAHIDEYSGSFDRCYLDNSEAIENDVGAISDAYGKVNDRVDAVQERYEVNEDIFGKSVNAERVRADLASQARATGGEINLGDKTIDGKSSVAVGDVLSESNVNSGHVSTAEVRELMLYQELRNNPDLSEAQRANLDEKAKQIALSVDSRKSTADQSQSLVERDLAPPVILDSGRKKIGAPVVQLDRAKHASFNFGNEVSHTSSVVTQDGTYILGLKEEGQKGTYNVKEVRKFDGTPVDTNEFVRKNNVGVVEAIDSGSYKNPIVDSDRVVRYYETEPYKGMPAVVPFDVDNGWYAATKQSLPAFGGIGAFDSSGRVSSFRLCNVGKNRKVDFDNGFDDDICQVINMNTGQPLGTFPGLNEQQARDLVGAAVNALEQAANQYGRGSVQINGQNMKVDKPAVSVPETQCQDFMSADDCALMFNVCDPVVCPTSRCNFGGKFNVANVAQSGIAGSALLCLPNFVGFGGDVAIPVCLTGIHAGVDGWLSIMRSYRDCLQESLDTGASVGICDQINSVYMCDFFWGQVAPVVNVLLPKLLESAYGQGTRGGGEYLTVNAAWQNTQNSINYFTQSYAANSLKSFQARETGVYGAAFGGSLTEIGAEFCKSFYSVKAPGNLATLVEPDSPPQFHAWFDSQRFSDATVPATSQYKVFYHIFAGNDAGIQFSVYLKNPPESSYYLSAERVNVASGFVPKGEYATESKDFTAPEGYKELCVRINNEEECGFKQVSTSAGLDYLTNQYAKSQINDYDIKTEKECISGSASAATLINPNIQAGAQEAINPAIYNRGISRICSTQNPGAGTDETRYTRVGVCGNDKLGCWLDRNSVDNAITDGDLLTRESTLESLEAQANANLGLNVLDEDVAVGALRDLRVKVGELYDSKDKVEAGAKLLAEVKGVEEKFVYNNHKAQLHLVIGEVNEILARESFKPVTSSAGEGVSTVVGAKTEVEAEEVSFYRLEKFGENQEEIFLNGESLDVIVTTEYSSSGVLIRGKIHDINQQEIGEIDSRGVIVITDSSVDEKVLFLNKVFYAQLVGGKLQYLPGKTGAAETSKSTGGQTSTSSFCRITEVYWEDAGGKKIDSAVEGQEVYVVANGDSSCNGKSASFKVLEDDFFVFNTKASNFPSNSTFEGTKARSQWVVEFDSTESSPTYFFEAKVVEEKFISDSSPILKVSRKAAETPTTTPPVTDKTYEVVDGEVTAGGEPTTITVEGQVVSVEGEKVGTVTDQGRINIIDELVRAANIAGDILVHLHGLDGNILTNEGKIVEPSTGKEVVVEETSGASASQGDYTLEEGIDQRRVLFNGEDTGISIVSDDFVWVNLLSADRVNPGVYNVGDIENGLVIRVDFDSAGYLQSDDETRGHLDILDGQAYVNLKNGFSV